MNKELPAIIRKIFYKPDPIIWKNEWLETLEILLKDRRMVIIWDNLLDIIQAQHKFYPELKLNQFIKWEVKAFVAQIIKLGNSRVNDEEFTVMLQNYLLRKNMNLEKQIINRIYEIVYEN